MSDDAATGRVTVLSHFGDAERLHLPADLADRVDVVAVPMRGELPDDVAGEVLLSIPSWPDNLAELFTRGVRWVHFVSTGVDSLDFDHLPAGVTVTNSRGASAIPISEWVLACMLAFEKRMPDIWLDAPPENWRADPHLGTLHGRRIGIVGFGAIGAAVAERALPFGAVVRGLRRTDQPSPVPGVELVRTLDEVLDDADHVVLAVPLTAATRHLVDASAFAAMKPGVHLVNIARGGLVDQDALRVALDDGVVACASLDAVDPEPLPEGHWLFEHPRVRLSAHDSWSWPESSDRFFDRFAANLRAYLAGDPLPDLVDPIERY